MTDNNHDKTLKCEHDNIENAVATENSEFVSAEISTALPSTSLTTASAANLHAMDYLQKQVDELKKAGLYRKLPVNSGPCEPVITLNGKAVINLCSNNYLGLASDPRLKEAAIAAIQKYGVGAGAVRTIVGNLEIHEELEKVLAEFKQEAKCFIFQSGYDCNIGTIQAICDGEDLLISDELNHASIIDGMRMVKATKKVYAHSNMEALEAILQENQGKYKNTFIFTDGVFSMDGDLAKLPEIVTLAEKYGAFTYVDDAHGSGVMGRNGRGTVDHFGLHGRVDFIIGTLSKAVGVKGGYVACSEAAYEWLSHRARPVLFSTTLSPADTAAAKRSIEILLTDDSLQQQLWSNARYFKAKLAKAGFNTGNSETPITPVIIGDEAQTMNFSRALLAKGVYVSAIVFPTVPRGTGRVRCMIQAAHTPEQLDKAVDIFMEVGKELGIIS